MPSPLETFSNCILEFKQITGYQYVSEKHRDEEIFTKLRIPALLTPTKQPYITAQTGVDTQYSMLEGYLFWGGKVPKGVSFPQDVPIEFVDGVKGVVQVSLKIPSPYYDEVGLLGIPINGKMQHYVY